MIFNITDKSSKTETSEVRRIVLEADTEVLVIDMVKPIDKRRHPSHIPVDVTVSDHYGKVLMSYPSRLQLDSALIQIYTELELKVKLKSCKIEDHGTVLFSLSEIAMCFGTTLTPHLLDMEHECVLPNGLYLGESEDHPYRITVTRKHSAGYAGDVVTTIKSEYTGLANQGTAVRSYTHVTIPTETPLTTDEKYFSKLLEYIGMN
ncbi:hypothetical protein PQC06_gp058 [Aeromonas phage LAh10]|uniref:Uncharacterized protein n=1 Tax=Aeromonas phage LAh10 TaxID=2591025 RepID=A0A514A1I5_9CAUD|nr:hypothetical protein PQC06_gp058 [Aeromonas phage LAh10]QDH47140.1 hypothetical protein LAh10_58 [Aeromonas phage LAh10]